MAKISELKREMEDLGDKDQAKNLQRFFKTGKGDYGEGDIFLGIKVPVQRKLSKKYYGLDVDKVFGLLQSKVHEHRLTALFILVLKFDKADEDLRKEIVSRYLKNTRYVNNWDLIDLSAPKIVGTYLLDKPKERKILYKLAKSNSLWERRIAILSTFAFINKGREYKDTLKIASILVDDKHDLIHKGVGWMLREVGKRVSQEKEEEFLKKYYKTMPRTMLRYAIERFSESKKKYYMAK